MGLIYNQKRINKNETLAPKLKWFEPSEFGVWWPYMDETLVMKLDALREAVGHPIMISPAIGSLGRGIDPLSGASDEDSAVSSWHNVFRNGAVKAVDVMPYTVDDFGTKQKLTPGQLGIFMYHAQKLGFGGIGVYPLWRPFPGFHLDVRPLKDDGTVATWSDIGVRDTQGRRAYVSVDEGLNTWG